MENILITRAKHGFSGWSVCVTEAEMMDIIAELKESRRPKVMKSWE